MIYEPVDQLAPIRQGDIFRDVPRIELSLNCIVTLSRNGVSGELAHIEQQWLDALQDKSVTEVLREPAGARLLRAILPLTPVYAIAISQDCDAIRDEELSFCEIAPLPKIWKDAEKKNSLSWFAKMLTRQSSEQIKFFYLPPDDRHSSVKIGFSERMAADFSSVLRLPRTEIESMKQLRTGRLNEESYQHFREKLANYFRRFAVDPWYPLNREEFEEYSKNRNNVTPRPYQK